MKRLALTLLLLLTGCAQAQAWTKLDQAACGSTGGATGFMAACSLNSTSADLLIVTYSSFSTNAVTLTDSKSNNWTCKTPATQSGSSVTLCYAWYNANALVVGTSHTISLTGTVIYPGATFSAWSGSKTSADPFDSDANGGNPSPETTRTIGPITPTGGANDLFVTTGGTGGTTEFDAASVASPFTMIARLVYQPATALSNQSWYATGTGATSAAWTFASGGDSLYMAAFLPGAAPSAGPSCTFSLLGVGKC